jgi:hypothetical protein
MSSLKIFEHESATTLTTGEGLRSIPTTAKNCGLLYSSCSVLTGKKKRGGKEVEKYL